MSGTGKRPQEGGDLVFSLYERQDRLYSQLNKKIERLDSRLAVLEERGRE